ncbi:MAG TPA: serine/threonine-protein kinase [Polyangiaceae bacterium]|nr:serine/threonine-protein kinase [Polyangiaceae bacterium]
MSETPEQSDGFHPGMLVAGRYRLDRLLGRGGMGEVWAVTHEVTGRLSALKLLHGPVRARPDRRRRFLREARAASAINHPNVVQIHDFFELPDGTPVMLMDLLEGETLGARLARERVLSVRDAVDVLLPVISAVGTAHSLGIIHRDLKPDNVFLGRGKGGALDVRVLDFGIAKLTAAWGKSEEAGSTTDTDAMLGTPHYMSPEQCFDQDAVDHRADVWALGVILYESLSGARPVDGENVGKVLANLMNEAVTPIQVLAPELPADVSTLVMRMLARDKTERPADLREVHDALSPHASVTVPLFDAATRERPPPLDSSPSSGQVNSRPPPPPPSIDDTEPGGPPPRSDGVLASRVVKEANTDAARAADGPAAKTVIRSSVPFVAGAALAILGAWVGVVFASRSGAAHEPEAPSVSAVPRVASPSPLAPSRAPAPAPAAPAAEPTAAPAPPIADDRRKPLVSVRPSASVPPPAPSAPPPRPSAPATGLVDEPPF